MTFDFGDGPERLVLELRQGMTFDAWTECRDPRYAKSEPVEYVRADRFEALTEQLAAARRDAEEAEAYAAELEAKLRKLEQWFDTDQEILDVMGNNEKADHMRKLKLIRDTLTGGKDE